jgi:hypothetical protein
MINSQQRNNTQMVTHQAPYTTNPPKHMNTTQTTPPPRADVGLYAQNHHMNEALTGQQNTNYQFDQ